MNTPLSKLKANDYRLSDLLTLLPFTHPRNVGMNRVRISLNSLHQELSMLTQANDVPASLREYYFELGKKIEAVHAQMVTVRASAKDSAKEFLRDAMPPWNSPLSADEVSRLLHLNSRLVELENAIYTRISDMHSHLIGLENPVKKGLEWDQFDGVEVELSLIFKPDSERPAYRHEGGALEKIAITHQVSLVPDINNLNDFDPSNSEYWGIGDGKCHNDIPLASGHPLAGLPLCMLFHELFDHCDIGLSGMLQLEQISFDIALRQSGSFTL